jgi:excisionase family DNA binding protein
MPPGLSRLGKSLFRQYRLCQCGDMVTPLNTSTGRAEASESKTTATHNTTTTAAPIPRLAFTMRETAEILGVSYITVHRLLKRGKIRASDAIRNKVIPRTEIERFLKESIATE